MVLSFETKYPSRRAYVVKLRSDAQPGSLAGRIENVITGAHRDFSSGSELLECLAGDLQVSTPEPGQNDRGLSTMRKP